jgi:hypothetical protein
MVGIFMATVLLVASETAGVVTQQHESAKKENPKSLPTLRGLESWATIFAPSSRRGSFSLDSPLYRTRLPDKWISGQKDLSGNPTYRDLAKYSIFLKQLR